jgi:hypothetical protein
MSRHVVHILTIVLYRVNLQALCGQNVEFFKRYGTRYI